MQFVSSVVEYKLVVACSQSSMIHSLASTAGAISAEPGEASTSERAVFLNAMKRHIKVTIPSSRISINDKGKQYTYFIIEVCEKENGLQFWRVEKRYSDFLKLHEDLKRTQSRQVLARLGKLPQKSLFESNSPLKNDKRKIALEVYLQYILNEIPDNAEIQQMLITDVIQTDKHKKAVESTKEGYLIKKGKSFGGWKTRYFVLADGVLKYFDSKEGKLQGCIALKEAIVAKQKALSAVAAPSSPIANQPASTSSSPEPNTEYRHAFLIIEMIPNKDSYAKRHILCASNDAERDEWVYQIAMWTQILSEESDSNYNTLRTTTEISNDRDDPGEVLADSSPETLSRQDDSRSTPDSLALTAGAEPLVESSTSPIQKRSNRRSPQNRSQKNRNTVILDEQDYEKALKHYEDDASTSGATIGKNKGADDTKAEGSDPIHAGHYDINSFAKNILFMPPQPNEFGSNPSIVEGTRKKPSKDFNGDGVDSTSGVTSPATGRTAKGISSFIASKTKSMFIATGLPGLVNGLTDSTSPSAAATNSQDRGWITHKPIEGPVFGVPLEKAVSLACVKEGYQLPAAVYRCIEYLDAKKGKVQTRHAWRHWCSFLFLLST